MTKRYMDGWVRGAEHGLRGNPPMNTEAYSPDYGEGYTEGYRIGEAFRDAR